ncbi:hypothetical protein PDJAM_G00030760 [Pangasius djambal]|uniref:Uncharacterized protein n=1 Tax=Pangasius djambal TaxID=1691987 RepID=A0ACC5YSK2_9TELE|nr:hypothetical protein [Pangasius djambal]
MAPKKRPVSLKQNLQFASPVQMKSPKADGIASDEDEDEDALEMERNFALFSKRGPVLKPEMSEKDEEETSGEESTEAAEDEEDHYPEHCVKEQAESTGMTGSEDSHKHRHCRQDHPTARSQTTTEFTPDLSTMSFEEIMRLQRKVGTKACNKLTHEAKRKRQNSEPAKGVTRDRPQEISAKKPVSFLRKVGSIKEPILRDPRFDDLSGEFKPEVFGQTYKFINDIRQKEAEMVKKKLKKENQKRNHQRQEQQREKELCYKRKQRVLVGDGHRPFYLKKSDQKKLQLAEKYCELKKSGKLENFLSKKRKRNAVKDRRKLP